MGSFIVAGAEDVLILSFIVVRERHIFCLGTRPCALLATIPM